MALSLENKDWKWSHAKRFLPFDLDSWAVKSGALKRRRGVADGEALVRSLLLTGLPKSSLSRASAMAEEAGIAKMNTTAFFKRLSQSETLLRSLFMETQKFTIDTGDGWKDYRLLAVDATCLCGPAATTTNQKLHTIYDLGKGLPVWVEITDRHGGEALWRHDFFGKGDLILSDAGYGYNKSFLHALNSKANILMRFNFQTVTLNDKNGQRIWAREINARMPQEDALDIEVHLPGWDKPLRAVGSRNDVGEPVWLLTDLSKKELSTYQVRQLYRRRWQIELFFKRMKSLVDMDELPSRDGPTVRPWIWAKLLLASLAILMVHERFSPWGAPEKQDEAEPMGQSRVRAMGTRKSAARSRSTEETGTSEGEILAPRKAA